MFRVGRVLLIAEGNFPRFAMFTALTSDSLIPSHHINLADKDQQMSHPTSDEIKAFSETLRKSVKIMNANLY